MTLHMFSMVLSLLHRGVYIVKHVNFNSSQAKDLRTRTRKSRKKWKEEKGKEKKKGKEEKS